MKRFFSILLTLVALASGRPAQAQSQASADDPYDAALHEQHLKAAEPQIKAAEAFAAGLMKRAADQKLDLTGYVKDAQYLANVDSPAAPEEAAKLEAVHRNTLGSVESMLGLPGLFDLLGGGGTQPSDALPPANPPVAVGGCGCESVVLNAPFPGYSRVNYPLGAAVVSPTPIWELSAEFRSGVIGAGHQVASTGDSFSASASVRSVRASATMNLFSDVGVGGLGVAHGWSDVQFVVRDAATRAEMCRSSRLETANLAAGAWYRRESRDLGDRTIGCSFVRAPGAAATYSAAIELRAYGTYAGLVGGHSLLRAKFGHIDVVLCP